MTAQDEPADQTANAHQPANAADPAASDDQSALDALVGTWMTLPDVAEHLGSDVSRVRRLLDDGLLVAVRRGSPKVLSVPRALVDPEPLTELPGTLSVLGDAGYSTYEALTWLFTPDPTLVLPGSPVENLRAGRKTEIRRRAQALGF